MRKILFRLLLLINIVFALGLALAALSVRISPADLWFAAFFGLAFPAFLLINLFFVVFWLIFRWRYLVVPVAVIFLCQGQVKNLLRVSRAENVTEPFEGQVKILSYNVRLFNYYQWIKEKGVHAQIINFIRDQNPGIVCLQEFFTTPRGEYAIAGIRMEWGNTPNTHIHYLHRNKKTGDFGLATFSAYPIVKKGHIDFDGSVYGCIYSDIKIGQDTIRLYNCQLQSTRIRDDDFQLLDSLLYSYNRKHIEGLKDMAGRMREAFILRARQVEKLAGHLAESPHPVILCGDFNDTPVSYTYHTLTHSLNDAYLVSGRGRGTTYFGRLPHFRIDYILHDRKIATKSFEISDVKWSDHFPISCNFVLLPDSR